MKQNLLCMKHILYAIIVVNLYICSDFSLNIFLFNA